MSPLNALDNTKLRRKKTVQFRAFTDEAFAKMEAVLNTYDWNYVFETTSPDKIHFFHKELYDIFDNCFPLKTKTFIDENKPYFTDKLAKLRRKKTREFNKNRRSSKYLALTKIYNLELLL